jgi:hypothetical protein
VPRRRRPQQTELLTSQGISADMTVEILQSRQLCLNPFVPSLSFRSYMIAGGLYRFISPLGSWAGSELDVDTLDFAPEQERP